jgi:hypothetical protein
VDKLASPVIVVLSEKYIKVPLSYCSLINIDKFVDIDASTDRLGTDLTLPCLAVPVTRVFTPSVPRQYTKHKIIFITTALNPE